MAFVTPEQAMSVSLEFKLFLGFIYRMQPVLVEILSSNKIYFKSR